MRLCIFFCSTRLGRPPFPLLTNCGPLANGFLWYARFGKSDGNELGLADTLTRLHTLATGMQA
jgi:hypothetical protein